ncbi:diguanylate cyclase, partial [Klebsiella pneumoniae]|nr:diguanylate cyclase [Klebsiella pneumoniae]
KSLACDDPGSWGLFVVDLDNLKIVNDTFGHRAGDGLLQTASARIAAAVSPDVTFRLGGDEFAVVIRRPEALADLDETAHR